MLARLNASTKFLPSLPVPQIDPELILKIRFDRRTTCNASERCVGLPVNVIGFVASPVGMPAGVGEVDAFVSR